MAFLPGRALCKRFRPSLGFACGGAALHRFRLAAAVGCIQPYGTADAPAHIVYDGGHRGGLTHDATGHSSGPSQQGRDHLTRHGPHARQQHRSCNASCCATQRQKRRQAHRFQRFTRDRCSLFSAHTAAQHNVNPNIVLRALCFRGRLALGLCRGGALGRSQCFPLWNPGNWRSGRFSALRWLFPESVLPYCAW